LLIDDERTNHELLQRYLAKDNWALAFAEGGEEGLRLARSIRPKVICLDILMPAMDGWTVLSALKADPETSGIPVVILSMTDDKNLGFALGASEYLTKPVSRDRLVEVMDKYIADRSRQAVLVIEDDATTSEMMAKLLQKEGYEVVQACNGKEALKRLQTQVPGMILLDLMMPEMDGFQFVAEMRKHEAWSTIPVVVVSAKSLTPEDRLKLNGQVEGVIQKGSFTHKELLAEIRRLMGADDVAYDSAGGR
jgi:CheY-like chemotaxis protein